MNHHYSIDSLFSSPTPQAQSPEQRERETMFPSLQPSRPRYPQPQPQQQQQKPFSSPLNQQPTRQTSSCTPSPLLTQAPSPSPFLPRSQMEAMPPFNPASSLAGSAQTQRILDAATRHPVFFTDRLKKAPVGVGAGEGAWASPIASGYVFNDGPGKKEGGVKL